MKFPRVGIIGAGQLGRMMALAAWPLGIECRFVDREADSPGGQVAPIRTADLDDIDALEALAREVDVVTFDIENVSTDALRTIGRLCPVYPDPDIVEIAQDRLDEKELFANLDIPTAPYVRIDSADSLDRAATRLGWPIVLKSRRLGYDGRGQRIAQNRDELAKMWDELERVPAIAEGFVRFDREVSIIAVRDRRSDRAAYALTENVHEDGILRTSVAPYMEPGLQAQAENAVWSIMDRFDYTGVLTIEFFAEGERLVANEMAPRVHNSGHWTIEGAETSQFENHIRAVLGLPLGSTASRGHAAMLNLLGRMPERASALGIAGLHLHDYGKQPRPARKLGHCTITDTDRTRLLRRFDQLRGEILELPTQPRNSRP